MARSRVNPQGKLLPVLFLLGVKHQVPCSLPVLFFGYKTSGNLFSSGSFSSRGKTSGTLFTSCSFFGYKTSGNLFSSGYFSSRDKTSGTLVHFRFIIFSRGKTSHITRGKPPSPPLIYMREK